MEKKRKIQLIRESMKQNRYPLKYESRYSYSDSNCYSYALGSRYKEERYSEGYIYNLGSMSGYDPPKDKKEAEEAFMSDMKVLGIKVRKSSLSEETRNGEWKVVLFFDYEFDEIYKISFRDFHFARQDEDGSWSHKEFIEGPVRSLGSNPEYCTDLDLVGYYMLKFEENSIKK